MFCNVYYNDPLYKNEGVMTITFSECVENQIGMEMIGKKCQNGFNYNDLLCAKKFFEKINCKCELIHLNELIKEYEENEQEKSEKSEKFKKTENAYLLIIRNGVKKIFESEKNIDVDEKNLYTELTSIPWDDKYWDRRR